MGQKAFQKTEGFRVDRVLGAEGYKEAGGRRGDKGP
jgi:hypothetical protein